MMAIVMESTAMTMTMNIETECFKSDSFAAVIQRFAAVIQRFTAVIQHFTAIIQHFPAVIQHFPAVIQRFAAVIQRFAAKLGESLTSMDTADVVAVSLKSVELSEAKT